LRDPPVGMVIFPEGEGEERGKEEDVGEGFLERVGEREGVVGVEGGEGLSTPKGNPAFGLLKVLLEAVAEKLLELLAEKLLEVLAGKLLGLLEEKLLEGLVKLLELLEEKLLEVLGKLLEVLALKGELFMKVNCCCCCVRLLLLLVVRL
jgi:hypothetical protein